MTSIGNSTFAGCTCLESIEIPASVTSIANYAFCDCTSLASVTIYAPSLSDYGYAVFRNNASGRKIYVFENCLDTYKAKASFMSVDANDVDAIPALAVHDAGGEQGNWCTYYNGLADVTVADGTTVYTAKRNNAGGVTLTATGSRIIKRGEAVLLKSTANVVLSSAASSGDGDYSGNELKGVDYETPQDANTTYYVLSKLEGKAFGFYKLKNGVNLGAHKAYLAVANSTDAPEFIGFDENTTGVVPIDHSPFSQRECGVARTIDHSAGAWYSIDGRKLQGKPTQKGLYIVNGNKVVIK